MDNKGLVRVIIADDHPVLRRGLRSAFDDEPGIDVVGEVGSFAELMQVLEMVVPDVVLLDLGGMGTPPITAVSGLSRSYPHVAVIIYSSTLSGAQELLRIGARGYIAKEDWEDDVVMAIQSVMRGEVFLSATVNEYLERSGAARAEHQLTSKELEVLRLVAEGYSTQDIVAHLTIAEQTVRNYVYSLFRKTGCSGRTQLVEWYHRMASGSS